MTRSNFTIAVAALAALGLAPAAANAAGPCSDQIAQLGRKLGGMTGLGAPVSEPGAGQQVGKDAAANAPSPSDRSQPGGASREAGGSPGTVGGVAGPVGAAAGGGQANAVASGQIATSPEDVRRQSEGKPTQAAAAASGKAAQDSSSDKVSMAKSDLQKATDLSAKNDSSCKNFIQHAENLLKGS